MRKVGTIFSLTVISVTPFLIAVLLIVALATPIGADYVEKQSTPWSPAVFFPLDSKSLPRIKNKLKQDSKLMKSFQLKCTSKAQRQKLNGCDADGDGLSNAVERWLGTNPLLADTDGDKISDFREISIKKSNPRDAQSPKPGTSRDECKNEFFDRFGNTRAFGIPAPFTGNAAEGMMVQKKKCMVCHGEEGLGGHYSEIKSSVARAPMNGIALKENDLADLVAHLNRDLLPSGCSPPSNGGKTPTPTPNSGGPGSGGPNPGDDDSTPPGPGEGGPSCDNEYFDAVGTSKPEKFGIPSGISGSISSGFSTLSTSCANGVCHLSGIADIQTKFNSLKLARSFANLKSVVQGPKMRLISVSDQAIADIVAYLNRELTKEGCAPPPPILPTAAPTATPSGTPPGACSPRAAFLAAKAACSSCHSGVGAYGNFRVDGAEWSSSSPDLLRAGRTVKSGAMPPRGTVPLSAEEFRAIEACFEGAPPAPSGESLLYNPGDPASPTSSFTFRRLSKTEYSNALRKVFSSTLVDNAAATLALHPDEDTAGKFSSVTGAAGFSHISAYNKMAFALSRAAVNDSAIRQRYSCLLEVPSQPSTPHVKFIAPDTATKGSWVPSYGQYYYQVAPGSGVNVGGRTSTVTLQNHSTHTWSASTDGDTRTPLVAPTGAARRAATWYSGGEFSATITPPAGIVSRISVYFLDYDRLGRAVQVKVKDTVSGTVLDTRSLSNFGEGVHLVWEIAKPVTVSITRTAGANGTISAVFIDPATTTASDDCFSSIGKEFLNRPVTTGELAAMRASYELGVQSKDVREGLVALLAFLAQHPGFIYQIDHTAPAASVGEKNMALTGYGIAQRIASALTKSPPDALLLQAAANGTLTDPSIRRQHAVRILQSDAAREVLSQFGVELVGATQISPPPADPTFLRGIQTERLIEAMRADIKSLVGAVVARGGSFRNLLLDRDAYVDEQLATIYDVRSLGVSFPAVRALNEAKYAGILTRAAVVSKGLLSSPYHFAKMIDTRFISCAPLPLPPADLLPRENPVDPSTAPGLTLRQRLERLTTQPNCIGCHRKLDFVFASGNYDPIGRWITSEAVKKADGSNVEMSIDSKSRVFYPGDSEGKEVNGPVELSTLISESTRSAQCFYLNWASHAMGRAIDPTEQSWVLSEAAGPSRIKGIEIRERIADIISSSAFGKVSVP